MSSILQRLQKNISKDFELKNKINIRNDYLDKVIKNLKRRAEEGSNPYEPEVLQLKAVKSFWDKPKLSTLKEARLVSFGIGLPIHSNGPCLLDDKDRFKAFLSNKTGIEQWVDEPKWFRRCYQGLVRSYFSYDKNNRSFTSEDSFNNWNLLRDYLHDRSSNITTTARINPDWTIAAIENKNLFTKDPCTKYAKQVLSGNADDINHIREKLGISDHSWFINELILSQIRYCTSLPYDEFKGFIPNLLNLLSNLAKHGIKTRNEGLRIILNAYALADSPTIHSQLRDVSVDWWGNPWLPSTAAQWGGVTKETREMVSEWLRGEFIEAFFTLLAEDGIGDKRRANFWLRYVKSMTNVQFALSPRTLNSRNNDLELLLKKMKGLYTELSGSGSTNNAFIMTLGELVAVEFSALGNAFYGYDKNYLPFTFDSVEPLSVSTSAINTLKSVDLRVIWLGHRDCIHGWDTWEEMFEATLIEHFNIYPDKTLQNRYKSSSNYKTTEYKTQNTLKNNLIQQYGSFDDENKLIALAKHKNFAIRNLKPKGGNLWAYTNDSDIELNQLFENWGFKYNPKKGWWK